jgi:hypothetical protein
VNDTVGETMLYLLVLGFDDGKSDNPAGGARLMPLALPDQAQGKADERILPGHFWQLCG